MKLDNYSNRLAFLEFILLCQQKILAIKQVKAIIMGELIARFLILLALAV